MASSRELQLLLTLKDQASDELKSVQGRVQKLQPTFKKMAAIGTAAFGGIAFGVKQATDAAGQAEGAWNKFGTVFGEGADDMRSFVEDLRTEMPTATHEIARMAADLQDLIVPMGVARDEAQGMSQRFLDVSNKIAAFNDVAPTEVLEAMRSGIAGMSRPLRQFGINANETALESKAIEMGLISASDSFAKLDQETKAQVRTQALLAQVYDQSSDAINGFEDNQDSFIRRSQELAATFQDIKVAIGNAVMPALDELLKSVIPIVQKIGDWIEANPELVATIIKVSAGLVGLVAVVGTLGILLGVISVAAIKITALLAALAGIVYLVTQNFDWLKEKAQAVWDLFKETKVFEMFRNAFLNIWNMIKFNVIPAFKDLWAALQELSPVFSYLGKIIGGVILVVLFALAAALTTVITIIVSLIEWGTKLATFFAEKLNEKIKESQEDWDNLVESLKTVVDWFKKAYDWARKLMRTLRNKALSGARSALEYSTAGLLEFDTGGVVPGRMGQPQLAMVHGGETILPTHKKNFSGGGGVTVNVYGDVSGEELVDKVSRSMERRIRNRIRV